MYNMQDMPKIEEYKKAFRPVNWQSIISQYERGEDNTTHKILFIQ